MIHSYPWYFDDWLLSQTRMSMNSAERGLYRDVLDICYRDGKIPDDANLLIRMLAISPKEFRSAWPAVRKQLVEVEGGLSHPRVIAELPDLQRLAEMRTIASRTAARTRWAKAKHARSNAQRMPDACETQCESDAISCPAFTITSAIATESESQSDQIDHEAEFLTRWNRWPSKGRTRRPLCEQRWCDLFQKLTTGESMGLLADIDAGLQRWLNSEQFHKGFVFGFSDFLAQRRWGEHPDRVTEAQAAEEQYSNQEVEDHWQEMQRLMKQGVKTHEADQQARQMIAERRRHAAAS